MLSSFGRLLRNVVGCVSRVPRCSLTTLDDDGDINPYKTTVTILNKEEGIFVDSYSTRGFTLTSGLAVIGPCVLFPKSILHWNVGGVQDINEDSLRLFTMLDPKLEVLILGVGNQENLVKLNSSAVEYLRKNKLNIEVLPTDQAFSTFNFLNAEKRYIAGAFIPPSFVGDYYGDEILPKRKRIKDE